jgi:hypothetical protein
VRSAEHRSSRHHQACITTSRQLIIDMYAAHVLRATDNDRVPQASWDQVQVFLPRSQKRQIVRSGLFNRRQLSGVTHFSRTTRERRREISDARQAQHARRTGGRPMPHWRQADLFHVVRVPFESRRRSRCIRGSRFTEFRWTNAARLGMRQYQTYYACVTRFRVALSSRSTPRNPRASKSCSETRSCTTRERPTGWSIPGGLLAGGRPASGPRAPSPHEAIARNPLNICEDEAFVISAVEPVPPRSRARSLSD